jgi:hypothetical protein
MAVRLLGAAGFSDTAIGGIALATVRLFSSPR